MKSKTKNMVPVALLLSVSAFMFNSAVEGAPAKDPVSGTGLSMLVLAPPPPGVMMQFAGSVDLLVRGEPVTVGLLVNAFSVAENDEGVQHVWASHILTFPDGSTLTTNDMEVAEPTDIPGVYALNGNLDVVAGTGVYEGASGHVTAHGTMDFRALPTASFEIRGAISSPAAE